MNTDRIARLYRWLEYAAFGKALERRRLALVGRLAGCRRALILGEGDGRFVAKLAAQIRDIRIEVVDSSERMIGLARARLTGVAESRVRFRQADARLVDWPARSYDLVVTNFFLDCLSDSDAGALISRVSGALEPGGLWVVSEFQEPGGGRLRRLHARAWLAVMYGFFRVATGLETSRLPPFNEYLRGAGLVLVEEQRARFGLIVSQLWRKK